MKKTIFWILGIGVILFCVVMISTFSKIHRQVDRITTVATNEYQLNAIASLTALIKSENHGFEEKNSAIWALGQFADLEALPFLEQLNSQTDGEKPCYRKNGLCKYEIEKAIKWCTQGNLTSWMYRNIEK